MTKLVWGVVVLVVLGAIAGFYYVAHAITLINSRSRASSAYVSGKWMKLNEAMSEGREGWPELQDLMDSSDPAVASQAAMLLATTEEDSSRLFFSKLPNVSATNRNQIRYTMFPAAVFDYAANVIPKGNDDEVKGAGMFLRMCNVFPTFSGAEKEEIFSTLVESMEEAKGDYADHLAFTIAIYDYGESASLVKKLKSKDSRVRKTAVQALGKIGRDDFLADVKALESDKDRSVRNAAVTAEASIKAKSAATQAGSGSSIQGSENAKKRLGMP